MWSSTNWRRMKEGGREGGAWWELMFMSDWLQDLNSWNIWVWVWQQWHMFFWKWWLTSLELYLHAWAASTESNPRKGMRLWHQLVWYIVERASVASIGVCFQGSRRGIGALFVCLEGKHRAQSVQGSVALPEHRSEATCPPLLQSLFAGEVFFTEGFAFDEKLYRKPILLKKERNAHPILPCLFLQLFDKISIVPSSRCLREVMRRRKLKCRDKLSSARDDRTCYLSHKERDVAKESVFIFLPFIRKIMLTRYCYQTKASAEPRGSSLCFLSDFSSFN